MNNKELKHLAEKHFFLSKQLTLEEVVLLRNSKYNKIIKFKDKFTALCEQVMDDKPPTRKRKKSYKHHFCTDVSKLDIRDLLDELEIEFNLDLDNISPSKYMDANLEDIKRFISKYAAKNIMDDATKCVIDEIIKPEATITDIMYTLYSYSY